MMKSGWASVSVDGQILWYPLRHSKMASLARWGIYESEVTAYLLGVFSNDMTFFDVGAQYGYYTLLAARRVKKVVAFEPRSKARRVLEANVKANCHNNVTIVPHPLFKKDVRGRMVASQFKEDPRGDIFARSLDGLNLGVPDVMKIDVEGAECDVLSGASQTLGARKARLVIELHAHKKLKDYGRDPECLKEILSGFGYVAEIIGKRDHGETFLIAEPGGA